VARTNPTYISGALDVIDHVPTQGGDLAGARVGVEGEFKVGGVDACRWAGEVGVHPGEQVVSFLNGERLDRLWGLGRQLDHLGQVGVQQLFTQGGVEHGAQ
jgi:hypothetical protein